MLFILFPVCVFFIVFQATMPVIIVQQRYNMDFEQLVNWIVTTPSLIEGNHIITDSTPFMNSNVNISNYYQGNSRLGFIYQYLCSELFQHSDHYEFLAEEIQIIKDKKTLGAIDFILKNKIDNTFEHWEVAVKFYLLFDGVWYGPNPQDRLDKKLHHMMTHQLKMSQTDVFKDEYPQWLTLSPKLLMQGRLYVNPFQCESIPKYCLENRINKERINGCWCYQSEIEKILEPIYPLEKWQWIVGDTDTTSRDPITSFGDRFIHCQSATGIFWFIVPNHWPKQH